MDSKYEFLRLYHMKKDFNLLAKKLTAIVDFIKWTSSFSHGTISQMEMPISGIRLSPSTLSLFGLAYDDLGWMLVMHEKEASWLADLPIGAAYVGFDDSLIIRTDEITIFDQRFEPCAISMFIPEVVMRTELASHNLLGFGLLRAGTNTVERVNKLVPLQNPHTYATAHTAEQRKPVRGLFSQQ